MNFKQRRGRLFQWFLAGLAILGAGAVHASDDCVRQHAVFDGIEDLYYRSVKSGRGERVYMFSRYGDDCQSSDRRPCKAPFVIAGDVVAVAKTCGDLSFVQYIGAKSITTGWVRANALGEWHPNSIGAAYQGSGDANRATKLRFRLIQGVGQPVCEAYLQRLNKTMFGAPEYCGRPENDAVPGFERLNRVYLDMKEVNAVVDTGIAEKFSVSTWRYDPPIDIDNDGRPDNVLIWNLDDPNEPSCGLNSGGPGGTDTGYQLALILKADNKTVDLDSTLAIFGNKDPRIAERVDIYGAGRAGTLIHDFPAYGRSYGVLRYRELTYFDTSIRNARERANLSLEPNELRVFLRRDQQTQAVCTLRTF